MKDTLGNQIEDVCEASCLVGGTRKCIDKDGKVFNHLVIVRRIFSSDAENLDRR